jgi:hypothetical protein
MNNAVRMGVLLGALICAGFAGEASARKVTTKPPIAQVRVGLLTPKNLRMGPSLVYRGGLTPVADMVRPRFVGGMIDVYPSSSGFRFSMGTRYFARTNFWIAAEQATRGILYDPHMTRGGRGLVRGFRRYTPAATVGYDLQPASGLVIGLESGLLTGRAITDIRPGRFGREDRDGRSGMNTITTLSARLAF